jgi:3-hydroxybutyryl-CoA dehydratase
VADEVNEAAVTPSVPNPATLSSATAQIDFVVSNAEQLAFANISGDFNPLHLDADFARSRGLSGAVVYGALIVARISQIVGMKLPGRDGIWSALKIDFREPLYVGEAAHLFAEVTHYSDATRSLSLKIKVTCADRVVATATALATLHAV